MKTKIIIVTLLLITLAIWIFRAKHQASQSPAIIKTDEVQTSVKVIPKESAMPVQSIALPTNTESYLIWEEKRQEQRKLAREKSLNEWKTPIEFYGRVIDESNNVIPGAKVNYSCNDTSPTGTSYYHMQSDANGGFSFKGIQGMLLEVDVSKEGYYSYDPHGQFFYYAGQDQNFVPDAGNPVVFRLRKKGEGADLIKADYPPFAHVAQLKHDGTPVELDLLNGTTSTGQLKLEFQRNLSEKNPKLFDWKLQLTMAGGGFIGTDEEFPFTAPETNYQSPLIFDMPTNNPEWQGEIHTNYYFQLPDGKYGRMSFEFLPWNGVFTIHSLINPSGSRNLEPK